MPAVLPQVVMSVRDDGTMTVTVDGTVFGPPPFAPPWRRDAFAQILDEFTDQRRCPVRVEVREADGTMFTDIITPSARRRADPEPEPAPPPTMTEAPGLLGLSSEGFVPGEDVAIAIVLAYTDAGPDGAVRGVLTAEQAGASPTREIVLLGRVSGTLAIGHPE
ncbi:Hypothetical protein PFR_JS12-1_2208 [Propionibacterium freudenreichii]|nr:Hypothetical protein PFR_JS12-2_2207 [Propionibacterium freudenreichii]SCC98176.1 Hypothetical protein PFR_JS12-1_2208 [Propionibacterium freudenreichii]